MGFFLGGRDESLLKLRYEDVRLTANVLKTTELHTVNGEIVWYAN